MSQKQRKALAIVVVAVIGIAALFGARAINKANEPKKPIDVAEQVLSEYLTDDMPVAGFDIGWSDVTVIAGDPLRKHVIYHKHEETSPIGSAVTYPPPQIPAGRFPLSESMERVRNHFERCEEWAWAKVRALSEQAVLTSLSCAQPDTLEPKRVAMLNDDVLPIIDDPLTKEAMAQLWQQIEVAGLKDLGVMKVHRDHPSMSIDFIRPGQRHIYEWRQHLHNGTTSLAASWHLTRNTFSIDEYPPARILEAFDEAMAQAGDTSRVGWMELGLLPDGDVHLRLYGSGMEDPRWVDVVVKKGQ